jgi:2-C-methyl-D-erythritol 2,4-cyclodiphosphate synthase
MGVLFAPDVRRLILAASSLAEARGRPHPHVRDLADALMSAGLALPPFPIAALNEDAETVLVVAARDAGSGEMTVDNLQHAFAGLQRPFEAHEEPAGVVTAAPSGTFRVGIGYDSHRFAPGGPMVLGGIRIEGDVHCEGHSDGDAVCHALTDALLGAASCGDIGEMFPDTDPANAGRDSTGMLRAACAAVAAKGLRIVNADITVIAERPRIGAHRDDMRRALALALGVDVGAVSLKGKTNEGMGWIGHGEGLAVIAVASLAPATALASAVAPVRR